MEDARNKAMKQKEKWMKEREMQKNLDQNLEEMGIDDFN